MVLYCNTDPISGFHNGTGGECKWVLRTLNRVREVSRSRYFKLGDKISGGSKREHPKLSMSDLLTFIVCRLLCAFQPHIGKRIAGLRW